MLQGDESIVNCLQPHPSYCFLATSGIDPVVRLWNPRPEVRVWRKWPKLDRDKGWAGPWQGLRLGLGGLGREMSHSDMEAAGMSELLPEDPALCHGGSHQFQMQ